ncbi:MULTISPECIES: hypothetical protein [Streptomyces]|uniref:Uncharacterized protein n=1 Tax=Streptomyces gilvifuscus TaxID=1550617 RepID=A0ABT5FZW4_9ACTN|nr:MULTISPECIES: hypothetical protein [Streptomyces]MBK3646530.1 hypothetical protein [Streptomyces sp. MBT33]MDC2958119.1 hypothetical protein [Streptomyces gilvifuscus]
MSGNAVLETDLKATTDVTEELVTRQQLPQARHSTGWPGAPGPSGASHFRRTAFSLHLG